MLEYGLLLVLIAVLLIVLVAILGDRITQIYCGIVLELRAAFSFPPLPAVCLTP
jgi:Flp pilus assembly pilin Flp